MINVNIYQILNKEFIIEGIKDEDYLNIYNYRNINKRDIEDPFFFEENEKYYYTYLKIFFLRENFYDTFVEDNYLRFYNYNNFINNLKKKTLINKFKKEKKINYFYNINNIDNILKIKNDILNNSFFTK